MTKTSIPINVLAYNKMCAHFLELETTMLMDGKIVYQVNSFTDSTTTCNLLQMKFAEDWNWLMAVVIKIETLEVVLSENYRKGFLKNSTHGNIHIEAGYDNRKEFSGWSSSVSIEMEHPYIYDSLNGETKRFPSKIKAMVSAVDHFLVWYFKNKDTL